MAQNWWEAAPVVTSEQWWDAAPLAEPEKPKQAWEQIDFSRPDGEVRRTIRQLPKDQQQQARKAWAENRVQKERSQARETTLGSIGLGVSDFVNQFGRGIPVIGAFADEANAAIAGIGASLFDPSIPAEARPFVYNEAYDEALEYGRARNRVGDDESSKLGSVPVVGDVHVSGVNKALGGLAGSLATPVLQVFRGGAVLPQAGNYAATGAVYGGLHGFGEGEGDSGNRVMTGAQGAAIGGALGGVAAPIAQGLGNAAAYAGSRLQRLPQQLQQFDRGAVKRVGESFRADDISGAPVATNRMGQQVQLGDDAMLADLGSNLTADASAIANQPGAGQHIIRQAMDARRGGAAGRITQDVDAALGPPVNIPQTADAMQQAARAQAKPLYDQFHALNIRPSPKLQRVIQRANATGAIRAARRLMETEGLPSTSFIRQFSDDYMTPMTGVRRESRQIVPSGLELDYIKRALDDMARNAGRGTNEERIFSNLARELRTEVDAILARQPTAPLGSRQGQAPGGVAGLWERARQIAGDDIRFRESMDEGQGAFRRNLSPDQMAYDLARMTPQQQTAYRTGARDEIRQIMGNKGTSFGPTGDTGARQALGNDNARQKLALIAGDQPAARLTNRLDAEGIMEGTRQTVTGNSLTAARQAAQQRFPSPVDGSRANAGFRNSSLLGMISEFGLNLFNALQGGAVNEARMRVAEDAARMLVAQGASRSQIVAGIQQYLQGQRLNDAQREAVTRLLRRAMVAPRQALIDGSATTETAPSL